MKWLFFIHILSITSFDEEGGVIVFNATFNKI